MGRPSSMSALVREASCGSSEAQRPYTPRLMADLPMDLSGELGERLSRCLDVEGKIPRALEALGPVAGRDVLLLDPTDGLRARQLRELGARVFLAESAPSGFGVPDGSADVVVSFWSSFRDAAPAELAAADRALRPGGRLLVVLDYGRDDVSHLRSDGPDYRAWSRPGGPFLKAGFKVRVVHCFWTFESMDDCGEFLAAGFAEAGRAVAAGLKRPRLSYNVAVYHRTFGEAETEAPPPTAIGPGNLADATGSAGARMAAG
jgi:SAM-dependent methyltransferase